MTTDQTDHRADPVQAVAEALEFQCLWIDGDLAVSLAEAAVAAARPAIEREAKAEAWDAGHEAGWWACHDEDDEPRNPYREVDQ